MYSPASVPPRTENCSAVTVALILQQDRQHDVFTWRGKCCPLIQCLEKAGFCVLFLIIRCQGFNTEQHWKVLFLQMLLVWDIKPCSASLHPTWNELEEADNENAAFLLISPPLAVIRAATGRKLMHALGMVHMWHSLGELRVSACISSCVWFRWQIINKEMIGGHTWVPEVSLTCCVHLLLLCMYRYVHPKWRGGINEESLWVSGRVTIAARRSKYVCSEGMVLLKATLLA